MSLPCLVTLKGIGLDEIWANGLIVLNRRCQDTGAAGPEVDCRKDTMTPGNMDHKCWDIAYPILMEVLLLTVKVSKHRELVG